MDKLLLKHKIVKGASSPAIPTDAHNSSTDALLPATATSQYKSLVMELNHLAVHTCPDIALAVSFAATKMQAPSRDDEAKLLRILLYLCKSRAQRMIIKPASLQLYVWIDASYACNDDSVSRQ